MIYTMTHRNNRAHVRTDPHSVILCLGDTTIAATLNAREPVAKRALARYEETAARINARLDATGRMNLLRASVITRQVVKEHRRELDDRP